MTETKTSIEQRLALIEDRLAIYNLLAAHPLSADIASEAVLRAMYTEDAILDRGEGLHGAQGIEGFVAFGKLPAHQEAIEGGIAHFGNLPLVQLAGDTAVATSYIMLLFPDRQGEDRELPNHGTSLGYRVHRVVANRWSLVREKGRWRIKSRKVFPIDGTLPARNLLAESAAPFHEEGA